MKVYNRDVSFKGRQFLKFGTATAASGAATLNALNGVITTEALTTAQNAIYTLTVTNRAIKANDVVFVTIKNGTNTQGVPTLATVRPLNGSLQIILGNQAATAVAFNGTLVISFTTYSVGR